MWWIKGGVWNWSHGFIMSEISLPSLFPHSMVAVSQKRSEVVAHSYLAFATCFCAKNTFIVGFHPTLRRCLIFHWGSPGIQQQPELDEHCWQEKVLIGKFQDSETKVKARGIHQLWSIFYWQYFLRIGTVWSGHETKGDQKRESERPAHSRISRPSSCMYETEA